MHLAAFSALGLIRTRQPIITDLVYTSAIESHSPLVPLSRLPIKSAARESVQSGSSSSEQGKLPSDFELSQLRSTVEQALNQRLKTRLMSSSKLSIVLKFSEFGALSETLIGISSGNSLIDQQVLAALSSSIVPPNLSFANLKVQIPIRLQ